MNDFPGRNSPGPSPSEERPDAAQQRPAEASEAPRTDDTAGADEAAHASQWAPQQPPRQQWSAPMGGSPWGGPPPGGPGRPPGPGTPPPPGYGARPGWGAWTPPPPEAPRPGVIPLRPLAVGEIMQGAIDTTRRYWRTALAISACLAVVTQAVTTIATGLWFGDGVDVESLKDSATPREILDAMGSSIGTLAVSLVLGLIGTIVATAMLTVVVSRAVLGRPASLGDAWRSARPQLLRMGGLLCLVPLLMSAALLAGLVPGLLLYAAGAGTLAGLLTALGALAGTVAMIWLWVRYSLATPALMLEKQSVLSAMRRSAKLVRDSWWRVLGIQLLTVVVATVTAAVINIPISLLQAIASGSAAPADQLTWSSLIISGIGAAISSTLTLPVTAGMTVLLYVDQRIRQESLDLELIRAGREKQSA
ncbi:glycerophosphoryl diester phosphodiesterase membrane domain-containing protein [Streptomyces orinoci]|uniref:Glycerophosphoryl diester phosphodiesterase membrane domain-containing protein n=1 Tax=Streptomyces orinoci TaxID=67339 RepID=A0ABV3K5U5_STRON|nr:glycerophosphoryl diester phosphodiesterase membrane domain-containing protein [Streptomyces orinoci]